MTTIEDVIQQAKEASGITDPEVQEIIARMVVRSAAVAAQAAAGQDVSEETAILKATALNLSEKARVAVGNSVGVFLTNIIQQSLLGIFRTL